MFPTKMFSLLSFVNWYVYFFSFASKLFKNTLIDDYSLMFVYLGRYFYMCTVEFFAEMGFSELILLKLNCNEKLSYRRFSLVIIKLKLVSPVK